MSDHLCVIGVCVCVCVCERERDRHTDRETDRPGWFTPTFGLTSTLVEVLFFHFFSSLTNSIIS